MRYSKSNEHFDKQIRGAMNTVLSLTDAEALRGVATHSSGNHGQVLRKGRGVGEGEGEGMRGLDRSGHLDKRVFL